MLNGIAQELPKGLVNWYEYKQNAEVLFVTAHTETDTALEDALRDQGLSLCVRNREEILTEDAVNGSSTHCGGKQYDYVILSAALELCREPKRLLGSLYELLCPDGRLLLGMNNRLGIRYFCGDRDPYTGRNFDGVENYIRADLEADGNYPGRMYSKAEMEEMLEQSGFKYHRFYSILPDLVMPQVFYAEDYLPEEDLKIRITPEYNSPDTVFLEEERMYADLIKNGLFHIMANAYLVECPLDGEFANVLHVTTSMDRGREHALATIIRRDDTVVKKAMYPEGESGLRKLAEHTEDLKAHGVKLVEGRMTGRDYVLTYLREETATDYLRRLLLEDREKFLEQMDRFREIILHSSEVMPYDKIDWDRFDPEWERRKADDPYREKWKEIAYGNHPENIGPVLAKGYIDLVCLNCFHVGEDFLFFDQEFCFPQIPLNTILWRTISLVYTGVKEKEALISLASLFERYHMTECMELWERGSACFTNDLRHVWELQPFYQKRRRDDGMLQGNRQRLNYSELEYQRLFLNIFHNIRGRKLYLFGSGEFAKRFLIRFGGEYDIEGILDNNEKKWGTQLQGISVMSPDVLRALSPKEYKVIVCIKNYRAVLRQLQEAGAEEIGIFDWNKEYPRRRAVSEKKTEEDAQEVTVRKYSVGYVAGVFDLFHIGHLNLLRRAKEQCEYLIVGVVSDEGVRRHKGAEPAVPFAERMEIVRACRYVDEAVELPLNYADTDEAYRKYHFDVQFSGSDYEDDPIWLAKKAFLNKHGAELVFFPYTEGTSSTKLKELISRKLL